MRGLAILLTLLSSIALSQEAVFKPKAYFGIFFSPNVDFRILKNESDAQIAPYLLNIRQENEVPKFGYDFGLDVNVLLTEHIGIEMGARYADKGYRHSINEIPYFIPVEGQATHSGFDYRYHHVKFPLGIHARFGKGKLKFSSALGVSFSYLVFVSSTQIYRYEDGSTKTQWESATGSFEKFNVFPYLSAGVMYEFNEKALLRAEPIAQFGALKTTTDPLTTYLWSAGLRLSFMFH